MTLLDIFDPKAQPKALGIDLGTTHSLVAYVRDGRAELLRDCDGVALLPSVVHYRPRGAPVVGTEAARLAETHPARTFSSIKRFMGKAAKEVSHGLLANLYQFADAEDEKTVHFLAGEQKVSPVEVSAEILKSLATRARDELQGVGGVVITVPAYFDDAQRQATKDAGKLAGLNVLRLLNEPTAAALAYGLEGGAEGTYAVYDLGGGTFDITILLLDDGVFQVRSTGGDSALGGDDFDRALAEGVILPAMGFGAVEDCEPAVLRMALDGARKLKHGLSEADAVELELPAKGGKDVVVKVTRQEFENLIAPLVKRTGKACRRALRDAGVAAEELQGVILVGGSTRVPYVQSYVEKLFGTTPHCELNPDEVVAMGAALQADMLSGDSELDDVLLLDVLPLSLGLETMGGVVDKILPRNSTIPCEARSTFTTYADNQTGFDLHVVQGEREFARDCRSLAKFTLKGIPPMAAGLARLDVTFEVDADGLLEVRAEELTTGTKQRVEVSPSYGLDDDQVEDMLIAALNHGEDDRTARRLAEERVEGERVVLATEKALKGDGADHLLPGEGETIQRALDAVRKALESTSPARIHNAVEALDRATHEWAGRRMDAALSSAIEGQSVTGVEEQVAQAKGVERRLVEDH